MSVDTCTSPCTKSAQATVDIEVVLKKIGIMSERVYELYETHPRMEWLSDLVNAVEAARYGLSNIEWKRWTPGQPGDAPIKEIARIAFCLGSLRAWCDAHDNGRTPDSVRERVRGFHFDAVELVNMLDDVDPFAETRVSRTCGCFLIPRRDSVEPIRVPMCADGMTLISQASSGCSEGAIGAVLDHFAIR